MSKLRKGDNPCAYAVNMVSDEKGSISIPPERYTITVGPIDVRNNLMRLTSVDKYSYKEIDGKIYRIGRNGVEYPPISKEQFEQIKKLQKEYFGRQKEDEGQEK